MSKHVLFKAALVGALAFGGIGAFAAPAGACSVNTGTCTGDCAVNAGACSGNCTTVNLLGNCGSCSPNAVNVLGKCS